MDAVAAALTRLSLGLIGAGSAPRLSILLFHRVLAKADPLFPEEPDALRFERLMRLVARCFRVMTLGQALAHLERGDLPARSMVITFDDGYADNAEVALPILQRLGLKATFFVATGFLDGGRMWNDTVIETLRACKLDAIDLTSFGLGRRPLGEDLARRRVIDALLPVIKYKSLTEREQALAELQTLAGAVSLPNDLMMSSEQVRGLHRAGMEIGGHTVHHPILAAIPSTDAEHEILEGKQQLERIIGAPVDVLAYPNGRPTRDYDARHMDQARRLGFRGAVSTAQGVARVGDDRFQLPRFTPWDSSVAKWLARLVMNQRNTRFERVEPDREASQGKLAEVPNSSA